MQFPGSELQSQRQPFSLLLVEIAYGRAEAGLDAANQQQRLVVELRAVGACAAKQAVGGRRQGPIVEFGALAS